MRCRTRRENDSQFNGGKNEELYARSFKMLKEGASLRKIKKEEWKYYRKQKTIWQWWREGTCSAFLSTYAVTYTRLALNEIAYILGISTSLVSHWRCAFVSRTRHTSAGFFFHFLLYPVQCSAVHPFLPTKSQIENRIYLLYKQPPSNGPAV